MPWARLDDTFHAHPKTAEAGTVGAGLFTMALSYSSEYLTDGYISVAVVKKLAWDIDDPIAVAERLVKAGYFEPAEGGYQIHDYLQYNPSKAEVMQGREIAKRRAAMNANPELAKVVKARDGNRCRYCGRWVDWRDRKGDSGGTYDHVVPISAGGSDDADNIVVCCRKCNLHKGARMPAEAGMKLLPVQDGIKPESSRDSDNPYPNPIPVPIPVPVLAAAAAPTTADEGVARLFRLIERAGIIITPANQDQYLALLDDYPDLHLLELAFTEAAAVNVQPNPKYLASMLARCKREHCLPGQWRSKQGARASPSPPPRGGPPGSDDEIMPSGLTRRQERYNANALASLQQEGVHDSGP